MWMSAGRTVRQPENVNDRGHFFYICFVYKDPTSAIMVTPLREEKDGMKLFHNTAGAVYPVKPGLIRRISLHQNSSFKLETTALVSAYAASHLIFALSLFHSVSDLIFYTFKILLLYSLRQNEEEFEKNLLIGARVLDNL